MIYIITDLSPGWFGLGFKVFVPVLFSVSVGLYWILTNKYTENCISFKHLLAIVMGFL